MNETVGNRLDDARFSGSGECDENCAGKCYDEADEGDDQRHRQSAELAVRIFADQQQKPVFLNDFQHYFTLSSYRLERIDESHMIANEMSM
ncbi:hypothetical protein D3C87_1792970 [compost metagenome]